MVDVFSGGGVAGGALNAARNSSDKNQYVGCSVILPEQPAQITLMQCYAKSKANILLSCYLVNPSEVTVQAVESLNKATYLTFDVDATGHCFDIEIYNNSAFL
jgi:hypothetical protein